MEWGIKAVKNIKQDIKNFYSGAGGDPDATLPYAFSHKYLIEGNILVNSVCYAHERVKQEIQRKEMSERAGAGGIIGAMAENIVTFLCTGNCIAYLYRGGRLSLVCRPDNLERGCRKFYRNDILAHHRPAALDFLIKYTLKFQKCGLPKGTFLPFAVMGFIPVLRTMSGRSFSKKPLLGMAMGRRWKN